MFCFPCFLMDPSLLTESLDSLWFFSNVLSSQTSPQKLVSSGETHQQPTKTLEETKPISSVLEKTQTHPQVPENSVPKRITCRESTSQLSKEEQSGEKKTKKKRKKTSLTKGLDHGYVSGVFWGINLGYNGCGGPNEVFETKKNDLIIPINDCMAMKEQLRTWAHAVACSVR